MPSNEIYLESVVVSLSIYCRETTTYISTKYSFGILVIFTLELLKIETPQVPILRGLLISTRWDISELFLTHFNFVSKIFFLETAVFYYRTLKQRVKLFTGAAWVSTTNNYHLLHYQANHHHINNPKLL